MRDWHEQDHYVVLRGQSIRYWKSMAAAPAEAVVLLHGNGFALEVWQALGTALAPHFDVYALDMLGYGKSAKPDCTYSSALLVDMLVAFLAAVKLGKAHLVGHSLGGQIALCCANLVPDRVGKLALIAPSGFGPLSPPVRFLASDLGRRMVLPFMACDPISRQVFRLALGHAPSLAMVSALAGHWRDPRLRRSFASAIQAYGNEGLVDTSLIRSPCLLLWGDRDAVHRSEQAAVAQQAIPQSELHMVRHAGHCVHVTHTDETNAHVLRFLMA